MADEFAPVLSKYYALGVAYSNRHPQNINNELRNAVTHMSRALVADDIEFARAELNAADRHIERFKRDCLKVCVIYAGRDADRMIRHVEEIYGRISVHDHLECIGITKDRYKVLLLEVLGDDGSANRWEKLLVRIEKLRESLLEQYDLIHPRKYVVYGTVSFLYKWFIRVSGSLVAAFLAAALAAAIFPHPETFSEKVQGVVVGVTGKMLGVRPQQPPAPQHGAGQVEKP